MNNKFTKSLTFCVIMGALSACQPNTSTDKNGATSASDVAATQQAVTNYTNAKAPVVASASDAQAPIAASDVKVAQETVTNHVNAVVASASDVKTALDNNETGNELPIALRDLLKETNLNLLSHEPSDLTGFTKIQTVSPMFEDNLMTMHVSNNGKYYISENGSLVNTRTGSVSMEHVLQNESISVKKNIEKYKGVGFDKSKTFTITKGEPIRKIAIFTDPNCPYCRQLEDTLKSVNNVELTYIYMPLLPNSGDTVNRLWNIEPAKRGEAWEKFLATGELPPPLPMVHKFDTSYKDKMLDELKISGTPTLFNIRNGKISKGALPLDRLLGFMDADLTEEEKKKVGSMENNNANAVSASAPVSK